MDAGNTGTFLLLAAVLAIVALAVVTFKRSTLSSRIETDSMDTIKHTGLPAIGAKGRVLKVLRPVGTIEVDAIPQVAG
jgi:hypothetical protein